MVQNWNLKEENVKNERGRKQRTPEIKNKKNTIIKVLKKKLSTYDLKGLCAIGKKKGILGRLVGDRVDKSNHIYVYQK